MIYDSRKLFEFEGDMYERLHNHPEGHKYRIVFGADDYDYVEDEALIASLDAHYS
jgi:hypothetical protein